MNNQVKTPIQMKDGWLEGSLIRRARKSFHCDYFKGAAKGGHCTNEIKPGDLYAEGELDSFRAGGFALQRYCLECAGYDETGKSTKSANTPTEK